MSDTPQKPPGTQAQIERAKAEIISLIDRRPAAPPASDDKALTALVAAIERLSDRLDRSESEMQSLRAQLASPPPAEIVGLSEVAAALSVSGQSAEVLATALRRADPAALASSLAQAAEIAKALASAAELRLPSADAIQAAAEQTQRWRKLAGWSASLTACGMLLACIAVWLGISATSGAAKASQDATAALAAVTRWGAYLDPTLTAIKAKLDAPPPPAKR